MSKWQRFLVIIQLCLAFSLVLWYVFQPFMGEYFSLRSRLLLYEYVFGNSEIFKNQADKESKLERNAQRYQQLKSSQKETIEKDYQALQNYSQRPALTKIQDGINLLFRYIPPFQLAWLFFVIIIGIMLLLQKPAAKQAAWILPLIALAYLVDNRMNGHSPALQADASLFPSENQLIAEYLPANTSKNNVQRHELQEGWNQYLLANWTTNATESKKETALEEAEFNFTIARLMLIRQMAPNYWLSSFNEKSGYGVLGMYVAWNFYFAWKMNQSRKRKLFRNRLLRRFGFRFTS